jgi:pimeloyl-ACP methyl ester carboxylesterase
MSTVFIIAGLDIHNTASSDKCEELRRAIQEKGHEVYPVDISWRQTTPSQFAKKFLPLYIAHKSADNIVIGNSFGAVVALLTAAELRPDKLILCSLSPFFEEDVRKKAWPTKRHRDKLGIRRLKDISNYSCEDLAEDLNRAKIKTTVMYGEREHQSSPPLVARAKEMHRLVKGSKIVEVPDAPHPFVAPEYVKGIAAEF